MRNLKLILTSRHAHIDMAVVGSRNQLLTRLEVGKSFCLKSSQPSNPQIPLHKLFCQLVKCFSSMSDDTEFTGEVESSLAPPPPGSLAIRRSSGLTRSERLLGKLSQRTFMSLWSYANVWRDQRSQGTTQGDGKEVCDLLVVFENHVIIFSDKHIDYKAHTDPNVAWRRWYTKAVKKSADQIYGAERWIRDHPDRLFLDPTCRQPFPLPLPAPERMKVHRIVVAHGAGRACRKHFGGGTGSLVLAPSIVGDDHLLLENPCHASAASATEGLQESQSARPFMVGHIDPRRGYVHVLDDTTLSVLLGALDTVTDFVNYLERKERLINSSKLLLAPGEEDLLGFYLRNVGPDGLNDFVIPDNFHGVVIEEGMWADFQAKPQRRAQLAADRISYAWDEIIERFSFHVLNDSQYHTTKRGAAHSETLIRFLAREPRTHRRFLADAFADMYKDIGEHLRRVRVIEPTEPGDPFYVFMILRRPDGVPYEQYREVRQKHLNEYLHVLKAINPQAQDIVGIAAGPIDNDSSEDLMYLDARTWTDELQNYGETLRQEASILVEYKRKRAQIKTYPDVALRPPADVRRLAKGANRNRGCPCGSGRKFKHCHGKPGK